MRCRIILLFVAVALLVSCQANYIRDVQGGSVAPSTSSTISGAREGANKQVISSQADSLIKISRIWADFFPANTSNQPI